MIGEYENLQERNDQIGEELDKFKSRILEVEENLVDDDSKRTGDPQSILNSIDKEVGSYKHIIKELEDQIIELKEEMKDLETSLDSQTDKTDFYRNLITTLKGDSEDEDLQQVVRKIAHDIETNKKLLSDLTALTEKNNDLNERLEVYERSYIHKEEAENHQKAVSQLEDDIQRFQTEICDLKQKNQELTTKTGSHKLEIQHYQNMIDELKTCLLYTSPSPRDS